MDITYAAASLYRGDHSPFSASTYGVQSSTNESSWSHTAKAAKTAAQTGVSATFAASKISESVSQALLLLQETGSVFDGEDTTLMDRRGVSDETRERFAQIVQDAVDNDAYSDPVAYIQSLSAADVEVLRQVHCLAEKSGVTGVSTREGAVNLLLPPDQCVDIDNNGVVSSGEATLFKFPPPNAPQSVKDAWEEMSKDMTMGEKLEAQIPFMVASIAANIKYDSNGTPVGIYGPDDPEYTNIFGTTEAEWDALLDRLRSSYAELAERDATQQSRLDMLNEFAALLDDRPARTAASESSATAAEAKKVVERINGVDVIVSGHSVDQREGVSLLRTVSGKLSYSPELYAQIQASAESGTAMPNTFLTSTAEALGPLPPGASSAYMNITNFKPAGKWERDPLSTPIDEADAYYRQDLGKYMEVVEVERQLKAEYGNDVKLVYSHADDGYIMLTPDDLHYGEMASAEDAVQTVLRDVRKGFVEADAVSDILGKYGYRV